MPKVKVKVARGAPLTSHASLEGGGAPTSSDASNKPSESLQKAMMGELPPWHLKALDATIIDWISLPKTNAPFDLAARYPMSSKERLLCLATQVLA